MSHFEAQLSIDIPVIPGGHDQGVNAAQRRRLGQRLRDQPQRRCCDRLARQSGADPRRAPGQVQTAPSRVATARRGQRRSCHSRARQRPRTLNVAEMLTGRRRVQYAGRGEHPQDARSLDLPKPPRQPLDLHQVAALGVRASPGQPAHIRCAEVREQLVSCPVGSGAGGGANP
jgi:hypothetical protein